MRFILSNYDLKDKYRKKTVVGSYDSVRDAMDVARAAGYEYYVIYDTIESRTLIQYGEQESD